MIINKVWAENVLKYSVLELSELPETGLIAVIGDNESGKSSIGESICFALFGRTFSLDVKDLDKVVRWGESRCSIKLDFTTPDGQSYQIARFLDDQGTHGASISRAGEEPMVRGVKEVEARLKQLIGFGYTEFAESFYLAQREITTPHPHSFAVKAMAGVDTMEKVVSTLQQEIARTKEQVAETEKQQGGVTVQITTLDVQEGHLESLEEAHAAENGSQQADAEQTATLKRAVKNQRGIRNTLKEQANSWLALKTDASYNDRQLQVSTLAQMLTEIKPLCGESEHTAGSFSELSDFAKDAREPLVSFATLRDRVATYRDKLGRLLGESETVDADAGNATFGARQAALLLHQANTESSRRTSRVLLITFVLLALACWCAWGLLSLMPDSLPARTLSGGLSNLRSDWETLLRPWFPAITAVVTMLCVGFLVWGKRLTARLEGCKAALVRLTGDTETARREYDELGDLDAMPLPQATRLLSSLKEMPVENELLGFVQGAGAVLIDRDQHRAHQKSFIESVEKLDQGIARRNADADQEIERLNESISKHVNRIAQLDGMLDHERNRVRKNQELSEISRMLDAKIEQLGHRVQVRDLSVDLLKGAGYYISQRFNHEIRNLSADSLPKFTNGRYEHLQIDENLKVKAFSNEKRDFMELDEISSGTQRQIMLAVRLALSQKLVNSVIHGAQMVFLDEPFAFFDERRTASALAVLPKVSGDFTQIWVTSQTFPRESRFDMYIECNAEETRSPVVKRGDTG